MAKGTRGRRRIASRQCRPAPYSLQSEGIHSKKCSNVLHKKDWEDATCAVCMECPHNAVLLLCSSHDKGCRPYMCSTSLRYSNCLDQYKKAYTKVKSCHHGQPLHGSVSSWPIEKCEITELACPLCRGQVKGWTVVEPARVYLNAKKRSCTQDHCSFIGTYKELRKHVRAEHPSARPREVDPILEQNWRSFEREQEQNDVISTIMSTMPGAMVLGDYVIEGNHFSSDTDEDETFDADAPESNGGFEAGIDSNLVNFFLLLHAFGPTRNVGRNRGTRRHEGNSGRTSHEGGVGFLSSDQDSDNDDDNDGGSGDNDGGIPFSHFPRQRRIVSARRSRR
ncbi:uncharacterized protein LOC132294330 [Cornus florida]|uniref:uncharacterized protein LOC132294330 n=1 Tax=Cornus florida TaxID=4283 RepID=UPI002898ED4D|nr:uncharacterized protein LOC132294330 [Cornus florida]XP_059648129.1 uncharacterized protein LOC132294330 [Cornus florida]XP_059648130.1 uncharacterized protein LOC132294330 [Cornus florida]XP_059648131.1 uncharacterized protein LOC132294330 [Cornus florida]